MNKEKFEEIYMKIFGFLAPAPLISFFSITAYVWLLMGAFMMVMIRGIKSGIKVSNKFDRSYLLYTIIVFVSTVICQIRMPKEWTTDLVTLTIQSVAVFILYFFYYSNNGSRAGIAFVQGVYLSAVVQMIWGYMQLILNYFGIDLNESVFNNLLGMYNDTSTHYTILGTVKVSGFCWNAGNFAPLMIVGFALSNNTYLRILFVVISLLSGSRTLIFGMLLCIALIAMFKWPKNRKISQNVVIRIVGVFFIALIILIVNIKSITPRIMNTIDSLNVFSNYFTEGSTNTHIMYLIKTFEITEKNDAITNLFGFGPKSSGFAFVKHYSFYSNLGKWCVECDYVNCLWNYGYLGFIAYYFWYVNNIRKCKLKLKDNMYIVMFLSLLVMGLMYNITFGWMHLLIIFIFILCKKNINVFTIDFLSKLSINARRPAMKSQA